jgi:enamine deaminase RidA (YjgF/YER057c/UK114 family)
MSPQPSPPDTPEARLIAAGYQLPSLPAPGGNYLSAKTVGNLVYLAGVISTDYDSEGNTRIVTAAPPGEFPAIEAGYAAARACALTQLAVLKQHLGSLSAIKSIVSVNGYVAAPAGFPDSPKIINGASDLLAEIFGEAGKHVRAAIAVASLPRNALVELQMLVEIW